MTLRRWLVKTRHNLFIWSYIFQVYFYSYFRYLYPKYWIKMVIPVFKKMYEKEDTIQGAISATFFRLYLTEQLFQYMSERYLYKKEYKLQRKRTRFPLFILPWLPKEGEISVV